MACVTASRLAVLGALLLAWPPGLAALDWAEIRERGELRVLVVGNDPHIRGFFDPTPQPVNPGFDRELLEGFARLHRLRLRVVALNSWDQVLPALVRNVGDVWAGDVTATPAREKSIAFTDEVFPTGTLLVTFGDRLPIDRLEQLKGLRVGVIKGTSMEEVLRGAGLPPGATIVDTLGPAEVLDTLRDGKVDVLAWGLENALLATRTEPRLRLGMTLGALKSLAFGIQKTAPELKGQLNTYLAEAKRSGSWSQLVIRYFGDQGIELLKRVRAEAGR